MKLDLVVEARDGAARAGYARTARGTFEVPCFMPVGTRGSVRALSTADVEELGFEIMLANTYHLMLRPGSDIVASQGGIHRFVGWEGHVLTDSGGFQVMSLSPMVDDDGVTFRSVYDGSTHRLTPERAVSAQQLIGADIQMALDVCPALPARPDVIRTAVERTHAWGVRARNAHHHPDQCLFGICQGGIDADLRAESAKRTVELGFDGFGIGGFSVGETRDEMLAPLEATIEQLPAEQPRYLMGVGDPVGLVEAIARGVDMFDSVMPTRLARHGTVLTSSGRIKIRNARYKGDAGPLDERCSCGVCQRWSRAYIHHLLGVGEPTALRLLTLHNLAWTLELLQRARDAVRTRGLEALRREIAKSWCSTGSDQARGPQLG